VLWHALVVVRAMWALLAHYFDEQRRNGACV
jgi:hypothetical protein